MVDKPAFKMGDHVEKISGSSWRGRVVGTYATDLTREGYAVESDTEKGSVQIYLAKALRLVTPANGEQVERVAKAIRPLIETDGEIYWASEYGRPAPQESIEAIARAAIDAATLSTPTEDARSRVKVLEEALERIAFLSTNHGGWFESDPSSSYCELGDIARTALGNKETDRHG